MVTSASPIISAAAVDAVRLGFRIEFDRASEPATPPMLVAGRPRTDGERADEARRHHRDADEEAENADPEQQQAVADRQPVPERAVDDQRERDSADDQRDDGAEAGEP